MPWRIVADHPACGTGEFGVVKETDSSLVACHPTKQAAEKHLAALYANEPAAATSSRGEDIVSTDIERRFTAGRVELRAKGDGKRSIGGYAAKFNRPSQNLGGFIERVDPAFFNKSRGDGWPDVLARYNHDDNMLLGTTEAGTLRLEIDGEGLLYEVDPPQSRSDIIELVERGDVQKSSFAFIAYEDDWGMSDQGFPQRTLLSGALRDVAPVNTPAYLDTSAGLRSLAAKFETDLEEVRSLAAANELVSFFKRTDGPQQPAKRSAAARLAHVKAIKL